jgi:ComF family protein
LSPGSWARTFSNFTLSTLFEPPCAGCRQRLAYPLDGAVCEECWTQLRLAPPLIDQLRGDGIDWSCAVDRYEGRMKEVIHALKYERRRSIAPPLGGLMRATGAHLLKDADLVVPVPLHRRREYQRGFNQADDLARHLGPPVVALLARIRNTRSQIDLPADERHQNVADAFSYHPSALGVPNVVVLVDDVSTTGSTLDACAKVLKRRGVKEVRALTAARVVTARR